MNFATPPAEPQPSGPAETLSTSDAAQHFAAPGWDPSEIDLCCPAPARIKETLLGGDCTFALEREWCARATRTMPRLPRVFLHEQQFLCRAISFAGAEAGIRRILAVGAGLPSAGAVHDYVPTSDSEVVYVDSDPFVLAYLDQVAAADDRVDYVRGSLLAPGTILTAGPVHRWLAEGAPVCLVLTAILETVEDTAALAGAVGEFAGRLPSGSLVIATHATVDAVPEALAMQMRQVCAAYRAEHRPERHLRTSDELRGILAGLELVAPGITFTAAWRSGQRDPAESMCLAAVARIPVRCSAPGSAARSVGVSGRTR